MQASQFLTLWFVVLSGIVAAGAIAVVHFAFERPATTVRAAIVVASYLAVTALLGWTGALRFDTTPPTMLLLIAATVVASIWLAASRFGGALAAAAPLAVLVGFQAFRFPLELLLHRAAIEGVMPEQMSYSGWNFDIVTGASAFVVALVLTKMKPSRARVALAGMWNVMGLGLLINIVTIALLSTPTPIRVFHNEPPNDWIARFPFVWLPELFVALALVGHLLIFRRLRAESRSTTEDTE
jgi:hypothetical protein